MAAATPVTKPLARPASPSAARVPGQAAPSPLTTKVPLQPAKSAAGRPPSSASVCVLEKTMDLALE